MNAAVVALRGGLTGKRFAVGSQPITFGRGDENDIVLTTPSASRVHAELRREDSVYVLYDRDSTNGTWVNGAAVTFRQLQPGDQIMIGDEVFRFELADTRSTILPTPTPAGDRLAPQAPKPVLRVTVTGGGPVGLSFALLLEHLMGPRAAVKVYDSRCPEPPIPEAPARCSRVPVQPRRLDGDVAQRPGLDRGSRSAQYPDRVR